MAYLILFSEDADNEIIDAFNWYNNQKQGLGEEFLKELDTCIIKLQTQPSYYGFVKKQYRSVNIRRFPYIIVFRIAGLKVFIKSVKHTSRKPFN